MAEDSVSGGSAVERATRGAEADAWRNDDRSRTEALRARIASLASGPDEYEPASDDDSPLQAIVSKAVEAALRDVLPALLDEHVRPLVHAAVADLTPSVYTAVETALEDAVGDLSVRVESLGRNWTAETGVMLDTLRRDLAAVVTPSPDPLDPAYDFTTDGESVGSFTGASTAAVAATLVDEIESLRRDMAAALEYVQDQVVRRSEQGFAQTSQALSELATEVSTELRARGSGDIDEARIAAFDAVVSEVRSVRDEVAAARAALDEQAARARDSADTVTEHIRLETAAVLGPIREEFVTTAEAQRADLAALADGVRDDVATLVEDVAGRVALGAEAATASAQAAAAAEARASIDHATGQLRAAADAIEVRTAAGAAEVARLADAVVAAGRAVVGHLAARDLMLEQVRDELAAQLIADLASGMSDKDRKAATRKMGGLLQRRRNARDAERWREARPARPTLPPGAENEADVLAVLDQVPGVGPELTDEPIAPTPVKRAPRRQARPTGVNVTSTAAPKKAPAKRAPRAAKSAEGTAPPRKRAAKKAAAPADRSAGGATQSRPKQVAAAEAAEAAGSATAPAAAAELAAAEQSAAAEAPAAVAERASAEPGK